MPRHSQCALQTAGCNENQTEKWQRFMENERASLRSQAVDNRTQQSQSARLLLHCNICGGLFKNERGVKIHQGKSKCKEQSQQRRAPKLTQSDISKFVKDVHQSVEEDQGQEANHSAPDLPAQPTQSTGRVGEPESQKDFERKPRLNLPPAADCRWAQLDDDINTILENTLKGDAAKKIKIMVDIVYQACHDTFGEKEGKTPRPPAGPSRRQRQIKELREELKTLKRRWREASDEERAALNEISREMRKRLIQLRSAETTREKQREKRRKRKAFFNNPFQFTADLLGKPKGGTLSCAKEEIEDSVAAAHGDSSRSIPLDGRLGLGHYSDKRWSRADTRARRGLVVQRVREAAEEDRQVKAIGLASQGRWTQWDQALERSLSWKELWQTDQGKLSFLLRSSTTFVREGDKAHKTGTGAKNPPSTLQRAFDWELRVDLKKKLVFPQDVAVTSLRPDMVLLSRSTKSIIIAELTVPWEERLATSHQLKKAKYQDLVDEATLKGWHATSYPIEVGCRGFPAKSVRYFLQKMGLEPKQLKKATRGIAAAAESSSRWLWLKRAHSWNPSAGEVFRLRGETPETLRSLLMMWKGSNNVDASRNTILEEVLHHHTTFLGPGGETSAYPWNSEYSTPYEYPMERGLQATDESSKSSAVPQKKPNYIPTVAQLNPSCQICFMIRNGSNMGEPLYRRTSDRSNFSPINSKLQSQFRYWSNASLTQRLFLL
ncbi:unnamed protein product [Leuciscus chuanchicus]